MVFTLACKDAGEDCPYVAQGETTEQVLADVAKHVKDVHGYTDEQLDDPALMETMKALLKQT